MNGPTPRPTRLRPQPGAPGRPIPEFLRAPTPEEQAADARARLDRARDALPALVSVRDQLREAFADGPVGPAVRAYLADRLDAAVAQMQRAIYPEPRS